MPLNKETKHKVSEFELPSFCYVCFRTNTLQKSIIPAYTTTTPDMGSIESLQFFSGIKKPTNVTMPLNKVIERFSLIVCTKVNTRSRL